MVAVGNCVEGERCKRWCEQALNGFFRTLERAKDETAQPTVHATEEPTKEKCAQQ